MGSSNHFTLWDCRSCDLDLMNVLCCVLIQILLQQPLNDQFTFWMDATGHIIILSYLTCSACVLKRVLCLCVFKHMCEISNCIVLCYNYVVFCHISWVWSLSAERGRPQTAAASGSRPPPRPREPDLPCSDRWPRKWSTACSLWPNIAPHCSTNAL